MIKYIVCIISYYILFCSYYIYLNIRTPIYDYSNTVQHDLKNEGINSLEEEYIYKPFKNALQKSDKIDYRFYLTSIENINLNRHIKNKYIDKDERFINVFNLNNVRYVWEENKLEHSHYFNFDSPNIYSDFPLVIPKKLVSKNKHIYLHIITYVNNHIYRHGCVSTILTKKEKYKKTEEPKVGYLWKWLIKKDKVKEEQFQQLENSAEYEKSKVNKKGKQNEENNNEGEEDIEEDEVDYMNDTDIAVMPVENKQKNLENKKNNEKEIKQNLNKKKKNENKKKKYNLLYITKRIKFGPVIEHNPINVKKIGYFSNIFLDKTTHTYHMPTYFNNYLTPDDEYELVFVHDEERSEVKVKQMNTKNVIAKHVNVENASTDSANIIQANNKKKKSFNINENKNDSKENIVYIQFSPISYTNYNLFNIITFNIDHIKRKFPFLSYDIDSLSIYLCENIKWLIVIYIIFISYIFINLIGFLYDMKEWMGVNNLFSYLPNAIHFEFLFTSFILLYLKSTSKCQILMFFCLLKMAVCTYKILKKCEVHIFFMYPYIYINNNNNDNIVNEKKSLLIIREIEKYIKIKIELLSMLLLVLFCIYNFLMYQYDSYYSLIVHTLGISAYIFNFLFMCTQVIKNYSNKSVPNCSCLYYFFLFLYILINDFFACVLRMPRISKCSAFGDDVIFLIYLLQILCYKKKPPTIHAVHSYISETEPKKTR
ncbi:serpentine receptor, putative [Hepatocystis sp. ex Piliocolobus tephrosceles]|nr:serpentine receptor, putative [Hepatocystis sp. ex Piliocolobus tephrosceles]